MKTLLVNKLVDVEASAMTQVARVKNALVRPFTNNLGGEMEHEGINKTVNTVGVFVIVLIIIGVLTFVTGTWNTLWPKIKTAIESLTSWTPTN